MEALDLSKLATKVKRTARGADVLALVEGVEKFLAEECLECKRRREATAARVQKHRKRKAKAP